MGKINKASFTGSHYQPYYEFWKPLVQNDPEFNFTQKSQVLKGNMPQEEYSFALEPVTNKVVLELVRNNDLGIYVVFLSAISILLKKYTELEGIVIHSPLYQHAGNAEIFEACVPLVVAPDSGLSFKTYLGRVKESVLDAYRFQNFPLNLLSQNRDEQLLRSNVLFSFHQIHQACTVTEKYDLHIRLHKSQNNALSLELCYDPRVFDASFIQRLNGYLHLVLQGLRHADQLIDQIEVMTEAEKAHLTYGPSLLDLFERKVRENPDGKAVDFKGTGLSYRQLNEKANHLARVIRKMEFIQRESIVGILLPRSEKMIIALIAIIKSGAAFLPIDINYPEERITYLLKDSGAGLLLTDSSLNKDLLQNYTGRYLNMDLVQEADVSTTLTPVNKPGDLAYVIYTSGSTGKPKGVALQHGNLLHYVSWANDYYFQDQKYKHFPLFTSLSFDLTITCIFTTLLRGDTIYVYPDEMEVTAILRHIFDPHTSVNAVKLTPSHISLLSYLGIKNTNVNHLITGGEALTVQQVKCLQKMNPGIKIYNEYGPTEATVGCMVKLVKHPGDITIGKPIVNTQVYLIDEQENLVPLGFKGEIVLAGAGIARGYLNQPELTAQKFIANPFSSKGDQVYKTGDIGRWLPNGELEYLGRSDNQVKIRGNRIELNEIEQVLLSHPQVEEALITVKEEEGLKTLVAYYKTAENLTASSLREFLLAQLPDYMVPAYFIAIDVFPLTHNGKINVRALPDPNNVNQGSYYKAPSTKTEELVQKVWLKVLSTKQISVDTNFFVIGGDSIKAVQISSLLYQEGIQIRVGDLLRNPTIEALSKVAIEAHDVVDQDFVTGDFALIPIQHEFFKSSRKFPEHFNFAMLFTLEKGANENMVRSIFSKIQEHHDALRITFDLSGTKIVQKNHGNEHEFQVEVVDLTAAVNESEALQAHAETLQASFQLENGPLMKLMLFRLAESDRLLIVVHHLVMDVVSWRIIFEDITTLFQQYQQGKPLILPLKTNSFKDWAEQLEAYAHHPDFLNAEAPYWSRVAKEPAQLISPDFESSVSLLEDAEKSTFTLEKKITHQLLSAVNKHYQTEINEVLLAALSLAVKQVFGVDQLLLDIEGHGREEITALNVTRTVGYFTTTYPVFIDSKTQETVENQLVLARSILKEVPFKGIGHGLLKHLSPPAYAAAVMVNPQICLNYFGQFDSDLDHLAIPLAKEATGSTQHKQELRHAYDFYITGYVENSQLTIRIDFSNKQYRSATVEQFSNAFRSSLTDIASLTNKVVEEIQ